MLDTPVSLLERVQRRGQSDDWESLVSIYTPLIRRWLLRDPALQADVRDLTQEVLTVVVQRLPDFVRRRTGSFRRWLRVITIRLLRNYWRERGVLARTGDWPIEGSILLQLEDPRSELSRQWDQEHDQHVVRSLLSMIEPEFSPRTWQAFTRYCVEHVPATKVAAELGVSTNVVFLAKSRILKRLREIGRGLID